MMSALLRGKSLAAFMVSLVVTPLIYIQAFNDFFHVGIPFTFDSWFLVFLVGILAAIIFIVVFFAVLLVGIKILGGLGVVVGLASVAALPLFYIVAFNFILSTSVPINWTSYIFVAVVQIMVIFVSWMINAVGGRSR